MIVAIMHWGCMGRYTQTMRVPDALIHSLQTARHVVVLTGAGISAESGLATFRTPQTGLWERFRPEELATPQAFQRDPALVWGWYEWRRMQVMRALPNPAHNAVAELRIRPGVVWFGESLPTDGWEAAQDAASGCDVFFCIGTSSVVQPAASLINFAMRAGAVTVQVNPNPTGLESHVTYELPLAAGAVLPGIIARLRASC